LDFLKSNLEEVVALRLKELQKTQEILRSSLESPKDMIILSIDKNFNYYYFNTQHEQIMLRDYGTKVEIGMNLLDAVTDESDRKKSAQNYSQALNGVSSTTIDEYDAVDKKSYETFYNPIINDGKEIIGATAFAQDITMRLQDHHNLKVSEEKFRLLYSTMDQGMALSQIIIDEQGKPVDYVFLDMNPSFIEQLGKRSSQAIGQAMSRVLPEIEQYWLDEFAKVATSGEPSHYENFLSMNQHHYAVHSYCPQPTQLAIIVTDITQRKQAEAHILYLSYHDQLTGLANRRFYEEALIRLDTLDNLPLSLIMGDVNGLKLINDTFGHVIGDALLVKIAEVLKKECRHDDIIARLGGDEFMILLPKTDALKAKTIIARIQHRLSEMNDDKITASVSFGYETKVTIEEDTVLLMKKTEDHMVQHKLTESTSLRSASVELIMKTFLEKNQREMLHSTRVSALSEALARELGMSQDDVNQTRITGLMHDIGKIGISESLLNLPRSLNDEEWTEIKKHTEIGYRILSASNTFYEIAEDVLQHHERYDGKGYPEGLKGEAISLIARIVSIADAYDAMSSDRPYRTAFGHDDIVEMLLANAGTQFDPNLIPIFITMINAHHKKNLA